MDSSAFGVQDLQACNLALRNMGGAYRVDCRHGTDFRGRIHSSRIGSLLLAEVKVSPCTVRRDFESGVPVADHFNIVLQVDGKARMRQCRAEAVLHPGDSTIIDSRFMSEFEAPDGFRQYGMAIPAEPIRRRLGRDGVPLARTIAGSGGAGRLLADIVTSCWRNASRLHRLDLIDLAVQVLIAATESVESGEHPKSPRDTSRSDVERFIDAHIDRPDLAPAMLASHFGMSVRQFYRLAISWGCTPGALIWSRRLARARALLAEDRSNSRVLDVALCCGFKDGAHFSRAYRREFGYAPRETRGLRNA